MNLQEAAKNYGIGIKHLQEMVRDEMIHETLDGNDKDNLSFLQFFWKSDKYCRMMVMDRPPAKRKKLCAESKVNGRIEKWIYSRFYNLRKNERLSVDVVAIELRNHFGVSLKKALSGKIREIRKIALSDRLKHQKKEAY